MTFFSLKSQVIQPKNGTFKGLFNEVNNGKTIQITIVNDTIFGPYKVWNEKNELIEEGFYDNRKHNYDTLLYKGKIYNKIRYSDGVYDGSERTSKYSNKIVFKDSINFFNYVYENSFATYHKQYGSFISSNDKGKHYNIIKVNNIYKPLLSEPYIEYFKDGSIKSITNDSIAYNCSLRKEIEYFPNSKNNVRLIRYYIDNYFSSSAHIIEHEYHFNQKIKRIENILNNKTIGEIFTFDKYGKRIYTKSR